MNEEFCLNNLGKEFFLEELDQFVMIVGYCLERLIVSLTTDDGWKDTGFHGDTMLISSPLNVSFWYVSIGDLRIKNL